MLLTNFQIELTFLLASWRLCLTINRLIASPKVQHNSTINDHCSRTFQDNAHLLLDKIILFMNTALWIFTNYALILCMLFKLSWEVLPFALWQSFSNLSTFRTLRIKASKNKVCYNLCARFWTIKITRTLRRFELDWSAHIYIYIHLLSRLKVFTVGGGLRGYLPISQVSQKMYYPLKHQILDIWAFCLC